MSTLEIVAALFGLVAVGLTIGRSVWCWPVGLVQVVLYSIVFYDAQLYSQTLLQFIFAILQLHGWWQWRLSLLESTAAMENKAIALIESEQVAVERLSTIRFLAFIALAIGISLLLGALMLKFTDAKWAMADASIAGLSLVAQWLLIHRKLENWFLWIAVNILTIIVCSAQELWPTVVLYIVFLGLAIHGWRVWHRNLKHETSS